jgi:hypothetical protein
LTRGLEGQLERLTEAYLLAVVPLPEYQRRRQALEQRLEALGRQADQLEAQVDRRAELAGWAASAADFCRRVRAGLAGADFAGKRQLVELLVDRVLVADGEVEIRYAIPLSPAGERVPFCHLRKDYLDGLITNDKFCLSRPGRLALSWWRYPLRRRDRDRSRAGTVPDPDGDRGGAHEAPVADSPPHAAGRGRGATVGPGVPADPGSGHGDRPADGTGTEHLLPGIAGGGP